MAEKPAESDEMRVLVAIDGSAGAGLAIDLTANIAWPVGTTVRVVEAVEMPAALFGGPWPAFVMVEADAIEADLRAEAARNVVEGRTRLERPGLSVESTDLRGRAATAIIEEAKAMAADLIVVGSRGHGTIESMLLGSVSAEVIDHSPVPVLVARCPGIDRVVLAWDGSSCASRAANLLLSWPFFAGSVVRVVAVADIGVPWWTGLPEMGSPEMMPMYVDAANATRRERDQLAREMTAELQAARLVVETDHREGDAATGILAAASSSNADLIVMGTHGRTGLARLILGSVARNVLHHASCSVLVVRGTSAETAA